MTVDAAPADGSSVPAALRRSRLNDEKLVRKRYAAERRFRAYGIAAILFGLTALVILFTDIISRGYTAFLQSEVTLNVFFDPEELAPSGQVTDESIREANFTKMARKALYAELGVEPQSRREKRQVNALISQNADVQLRRAFEADPSLLGKTVPVQVLADGYVDTLIKGQFDRNIPEADRKIKDNQLAWIDKLVADGKLDTAFNWGLFTYGASSRTESAGIGVAILGSLYMMLIVVLVTVPLGVAAAVYLEEFAPKNFVTDVVEVNINNLAAVPSIVYGLLGLAIFINFAGLPRSAAVVGGLVLSLMTLPTVIIATRAAVGAVPPSIREAALGVGASKLQTVTHHVLPLAVPGILTGTIIGLAKALGETAPLLMIGMVAFVVEYPTTPLEPSTALPVQIFMWANSAERGFVERTAGAIMILLAFLICMNLIAVILRRRYERRW